VLSALCQLPPIKRSGHTRLAANKTINVYSVHETVCAHRRKKRTRQKVATRMYVFARHLPQVLKASLSWLINFIEQLYLTPADLKFVEPAAAGI
jgi:hypothetical protein